jgi:hypothetical protein
MSQTHENNSNVGMGSFSLIMPVILKLNIDCATAYSRRGECPAMPIALHR